MGLFGWTSRSPNEALSPNERTSPAAVANRYPAGVSTANAVPSSMEIGGLVDDVRVKVRHGGALPSVIGPGSPTTGIHPGVLPDPGGVHHFGDAPRCGSQSTTVILVKRLPGVVSTSKNRAAAVKPDAPTGSPA